MKNQLCIVNNALKTVVEQYQLPKLTKKLKKLKRKIDIKNRQIKLYKDYLDNNKVKYVRKCSYCNSLGSVQYDDFSTCFNCEINRIPAEDKKKWACPGCSNHCEQCSNVYCENCTDEHLTEFEFKDTNNNGDFDFTGHICDDCLS